MDLDERGQKIVEHNRQLRERELNDLRKVLTLPEGRRLVWKILSEAETFKAPATEKQIVGMRLLNDLLQAAPEIFIQMMNEHKSEAVSIKNQLFTKDDDI